jgi:hypothetical protein
MRVVRPDGGIETGRSGTLSPAQRRAGDAASATWSRGWALWALRRTLTHWLADQWVLAEVAAPPAPTRSRAATAGAAGCVFLFGGQTLATGDDAAPTNAILRCGPAL